jgi:uncharacterized membrane protein YfcA
MATEVEKEFLQKSGQFWLWIGLLLPPIIWSVQLETVYLLTDYGCATANFLPSHIASAIALILSVLGGLISWHNWMKTGGEWKSEKAEPISRSSFIAILGVLTGALFSLIILAQWLPTILGVPCDK